MHGGFASVYEGELHIAVEKGMVTSRRTLDNRAGVSGALLAMAILALLAGNVFATLRNGQPATNARTACLLWAGGLVACAVILAKGAARRRPVLLVSTLVLTALLGGSIALSVAELPAARRFEEGRRHPVAPPPPPP